jgi:predicted nucleic acid-binding protein
MTLIVSDASPLHYLARIGEVHILPALYGRIIIPQKVFNELQQPSTHVVVKTFVSSLPPWLEIRAVTTPIDASLSHLDRGEQEAITLALEIQAEVLLIDETKGRDAAELR